MTEDAATPPDLGAGIDISRIPDGSLLAGTVGEEAVLLTRFGDDIRAFSGKCTHLGAPLAKGLVSDGQVKCPWHHACFDLRTGAAGAAPAFDALPPWKVVRRGTVVQVTAATDTAPAAPRRSAAAPQFVILGGGAAGYAAAVRLRRDGFAGAITMISADTRAPYDRTLLTKDYLDGKFGDDRLPIAKRSLPDVDVMLHLNVTATALDPYGKTLALADGRKLRYDKLLLATGAEPQRPDIPGASLPHVGVLRTVEDCKDLLERLGTAKAVVVIGGSFIGLEAAASIRSKGFAVTVVTPETAPMAKTIGAALSDTIVAVHRDKGVAFRLGAPVAAITSDTVLLADGTRLPADAVVLGVGVKPRTEIAAAAGLAVDDGVLVDAHLRTSDPDIFAAGDIAAWPDPRGGTRLRVEHWVVAQRQGEVAAANMAGAAIAYDDVPFFWSKHFDFSFRYVGHAERWEAVEVDGDLAKRDATVRFISGGRDAAIATVGRDMAALQAARAMRQHVR